MLVLLPPGAGVKLWHDDVRPAPKGWVWAQNNADAMAILKTGEVTEISMDHDLGGDPRNGIFVAGNSQDGSGLDLVQWMVETINVPETITIHSWNPDGARRMARVFNDAGYSVTVAPYSISVKT